MILLYRGNEFNTNFYYYSGIDIDHAFLVLPKKIILVPKMNQKLAKKIFKGKVISYSNYSEELKKILGKKTEIDGASLPTRVYLRLKKITKMGDSTERFFEERSKKKPQEISNIRRAVKETKEIIESVDFKKYKTEMDVKKYLLQETFERGLEPAFEPIVASGVNTSHPHHSSGKKKLKGPMMIDYGVKYNHYCGDITRCFMLKGKAKDEYEKLQQVNSEIVDELCNLRNGKEVSLFAEKTVKKYGFPKMIHSIGHGIGLDVHEFPRLNRKYKDGIKGTSFAIEPGVYGSKYGLRYEETIYFDGKKGRIL